MANEKFDGVETLIRKLRNHEGVLECNLAREDGDKFVYQISFSESFDRQGIKDILGSFRSWMSDYGYNADDSVSVYDSHTGDKTGTFQSLEENQRVLVLDF